MKKMRHILSLFLALWVAASSMGMHVSSHTCKESGFAEVKIGNLKACCPGHDLDGLSSEACCTLKVQKVKLPTLRLQDPTFDSPNWMTVLAIADLPTFSIELPSTSESLYHESNAPPLDDGRSHLIRFCQYRI
jgi:hypothetical protein